MAAAALPRALSRLCPRRCPRRCPAVPRPAWTGGHRGHRGDSGSAGRARWARPAGAALAFLGGERGGGHGHRAAGSGHPPRCPRRLLPVPAGRRGGRRGRHRAAAEESQGEAVRAERAERARPPAVPAVTGPAAPAAQRHQRGAGPGRAAPAPGPAPGAPAGEPAGRHLHLQHDGERGLHAGTAGQSEEKANTQLLLGMSLDSYGRYLLNINELSAAQKMYEKALQISNDVQGETHPQSVVLMNDLATVLDAQGRYEEAHTYSRRAAELARDTKHPEEHMVLSNLAAILMHKEDFLQAKQVYKEALKQAQQKGDAASVQHIQEELAELAKRRKGSK
uniref:Tetratricopeptide repeat domain 19 n=1 Tax=Taeniopygia guttata TaxID=59729 RepID=A0A674HEL4_TAEGU